MSSFLILKRCLSSSSSSSSILLVESMYSLSIAPRRSLISQVVNNNHQKNHCNINSHLTNLRSNLNNGCSLNSCLQMRFSTLSSSSNLTLGRKSSVEKESTLTSKKVVEPLVAAKKITKTSQAGQANKPSETSKVVKADKLKLTDSVNKVAKVVKGDKVDKTDKVEKKQPTKSIKVSNSQKDIVSAANKEIKQGVEKPEIEKLVRRE